MLPVNRREFLATSAAQVAVGSWALATSAPAKATASDRLQVGCVGAKGRAGYLLATFAGLPDVDVVAVADIDSRHLAAGVETVEKLQGRQPRAESDFRRLVDDPKIDALV